MTEEVHIELAKISREEKVELDQILTHQRIHVGNVAQFAMALMNVGMLQPCVPDGEDSHGSRQYRMLTEQELVDRSMKIAEMAYAAFLEKGWVAKAPPLDDLRRPERDPIGFHKQANGAQAA
jgi:hypothetical protein